MFFETVYTFLYLDLSEDVVLLLLLLLLIYIILFTLHEREW